MLRSTEPLIVPPSTPQISSSPKPLRISNGILQGLTLEVNVFDSLHVLNATMPPYASVAVEIWRAQAGLAEGALDSKKDQIKALFQAWHAKHLAKAGQERVCSAITPCVGVMPVHL